MVHFTGREAKDILSWSEHVFVKIPTTVEGLKAMKQISSWRNGRINATLIFSATQAYLAARAGASYASIFVGRMDDAGLEGMEVVRRRPGAVPGRLGGGSWRQVGGFLSGVGERMGSVEEARDGCCGCLHGVRLGRLLDRWSIHCPDVAGFEDVFIPMSALRASRRAGDDDEKGSRDRASWA